jgi:hypothetical protein
MKVGSLFSNIMKPDSWFSNIFQFKYTCKTHPNAVVVPTRIASSKKANSNMGPQQSIQNAKQNANVEGESCKPHKVSFDENNIIVNGTVFVAKDVLHALDKIYSLQLFTPMIATFKSYLGEERELTSDKDILTLLKNVHNRNVNLLKHIEGLTSMDLSNNNDKTHINVGLITLSYVSSDLLPKILLMQTQADDIIRKYLQENDNITFSETIVKSTVDILKGKQNSINLEEVLKQLEVLYNTLIDVCDMYEYSLNVLIDISKTKQGGAGVKRNPSCIKTSSKVKIGKREYVVYEGKRGGKYIKSKGVYVSLKKVQS